MRQRFFSKPGYVPKVYGYRHETDSEDGVLIPYYNTLRFKGGIVPIHVEPPSERGQSLPLRRRHTGQKILKLLQPEDHLIVYSADRISISLEDFLATLRYFYERGVHLHLCEFWGTPLDCWSTPGRMVLDSLEVSAEVSKLWFKKAARQFNFQKAKQPKRIHNGKPAPWFCEVTEDGQRISIRPTVASALENLCLQRDQHGWSWSKLSDRLYEDCEQLTGRRLAKYRGKAKEAIDAYCFYKGWEERGFPDLNEVSPASIKNEYRAKLFPQESGDGQTDV